MARELILLELLLALPPLWIGKNLRRRLTGNQAKRQCNVYYDYTPSL
jgi:hypothetical protein